LKHLISSILLLLNPILGNPVYIPSIPDPEYFSVNTSIYNSTPEQCKPVNYNITYSGLKIEGAYSNLRVIAISVDLLDVLEMGSWVYVKSDDTLVSGTWQVQDVMNSRFRKSIDFLVEPKHNMLFRDFHKSAVEITKVNQLSTNPGRFSYYYLH